MTSRKKAEEQASQRLIELDTILGSIADGVIVYDTDSKIIRMNAAAETILKYPQADLKMSIQDRVKERYGVWSEDGRRLNPEEMPAMRASKYGEKITGTVVRIQGAGGSRWIIVSAAPLIVSGRQTGAVASMSDITEIKKAEEAISKTKEQYEILFNSIEEGFAHYKAIYDENGRLDDILVLDINPTGAKLSGSSREDQVGRQWKRVWTGIEDSLFDIYREVDKTGEFISFEHFSGITNRWYVSNIYKIGVGEFAVTFFDITDRKLAEINLNRTLVELERSNRDLERFASAASHDLQEPIRMMGSYASLLMKRYNGKLDPQADRYLKFMFEGAIRLQILIKDILNYARLRSDKMAFSRVDLNAVLIAVLDDLRNPVAETGAVINYGELPKIVADRKQIIQLFTNLLSNAIKFRRKNTVPEINILAEDRGKEWLFSVKDNGIGIEPEFAKLIFNIFQRLNEREEYPGVGIGLAICKRIVERHEGSIWMESEVGKGSRFYFIIPKKESDV
ncbi:MAG: PAS domain S-box protein [Ignavibacteria bacterium]|jgi:PAS domain S-box-containing protein|nr:PAS domain S-box protein [Ignavibacteria bacterium]